MLKLEDVLKRLLAQVRPLDAVRVSLADALGRVPVDAALVATHDVPPFANSAMDGYAVLSREADAERRVSGESRAGGPVPPAVESGTAVRIMTGAPMPAGADAVIPIEDASEADERVRFAAVPAPGAHVRAAGHDVAKGTGVRLLRQPITSSTIGLLAALGIAELEVHRRPRVAILSTGDELQPVGALLEPGRIHDANGPALTAAVTESGGEPVVLETAGDDAAIIEERLGDGVGRADLLLVSGGVSVGARDHVRDVIERLGTLDFWRIAVQPGKPLAFGRVGERPVIGLPGNPVSALVTFELFVRPMLRRMLDLNGDGRLRVRARVDETIGTDIGRRTFVRVRVEADGDEYRASSTGGQQSSQLLPLASANGLLVVPEGVPDTVPGTFYETILLGAVE